MTHYLLLILATLAVCYLLDFLFFGENALISFRLGREEQEQPAPHHRYDLPVYRITFRSGLAANTQTLERQVAALVAGETFVQFVDEDGQVGLILSTHDVLAIERK